MRKNKPLAAFLLPLVITCGILSFTLMSCEEHHHGTTFETVTEEAGEFLLTYDGSTYTIGDINVPGGISNISVHIGDTLSFNFAPDTDYAHENFKHSISLNGTFISDTLVITPDYTVGQTLHLQLYASYTDSIKHKIYSANKVLDITVELFEFYDNESCSIEAYNVSSGEIIDGSSDGSIAHFFVGDTIKLKVNYDNDSYSQYHFTLASDKLTQINDSMFVVPNLETTFYSGGISVTSSKQVTLSASCDIVSTGKEIHISSTRKLRVTTAPQNANIRYTIAVSQDLLQFVDVQISYNDLEENPVVKILNDEDWIRDTMTLYTYLDGDGKEHTTNHESDEEGWVKIEEKTIDLNPKYFVEFNYDHYPIHNEISVRYILKDNNIELTKEKYNFSHKIYHDVTAYPKSGSINSLTNKGITITIGDTSTKRNEAQAYIEQLVSKPEHVAIEIDKEGVITKLKD